MLLQHVDGTGRYVQSRVQLAHAAKNSHRISVRVQAFYQLSICLERNFNH
jgi:hypothetical protein